MRLEFRRWLAEAHNLSDPDDASLPSEGSYLAVFKFDVDIDRDFEDRAARMDTLQKTLSGEEAETVPEQEIREGEWSVAHIFPFEGWQPSAEEMANANMYAKLVAAAPGDTYATLVAGCRQPGQFIPSTIYISTSPQNRGQRKRVTTIQLNTAASYAGKLSNAVRRMMDKFNLQHRQVWKMQAFDLGGQRLDNFVRKLYPNQYKGYEHFLVLTPSGWKADDKNGLPHRSMDAGDKDFMPLHRYDGRTIVSHHSVGCWTRWLREQNRWQPTEMHLEVDGHNVHFGDFDLKHRPAEYRRGVEQLGRLLDQIPWMNDSLRRVANPFAMKPEEWNEIAHWTITAAVDDDMYQRTPTRVT